ncbi:MAG: hypothetical protein AABY42_01705 [Nitrospirota bacterium]
MRGAIEKKVAGEVNKLVKRVSEAAGSFTETQPEISRRHNEVVIAV